MEHWSHAMGVLVGAGVGLAVARLTARPPGAGGEGAECAEVEAELRRLVIEGRKSGVTFDNFGRYHLSEEMKRAVTTAAYPYLSQTELPKHIRLLPTSSRTILLCGTSDKYLESLAKGLAHKFSAHLLPLDLVEFLNRVQHKYGNPGNALGHRRSVVSKTTMDRASCNKDKPTDSMSWGLDMKILTKSIYKIVTSISECYPVIFYIRDVNQFLACLDKAYIMFQEMLNKLSGRVFVIGSYFVDSDEHSIDVDEDVRALFPSILETKPPKEKIDLDKWKIDMIRDKRKIRFNQYIRHIEEVLSENCLQCDDLSSIKYDHLIVVANNIEEIMSPAVYYYLMNHKDPKYRDGKLIIPLESLSEGLSIFQVCNPRKHTVGAKGKTKKSGLDNEYEKWIRASVIPANTIGVKFDDIGALSEIKESLEEFVMLPLQRPDLFKGGLLKQCSGILLFGPPGTGKTMLAKAIANEAGASFLNISMSCITSKWHGESEKATQALFTLAAKIAPAIIFIDEVDSMLGRRDHRGESGVWRRVKNEFMTHWDGLLSKSNKQILVLAATNRPFDLDEAAIRRFEHRIMVGLPSLESRELILEKLLSKEKVENIDFKELAGMTQGYSSSDLKNLCTTAAYRPVRELLHEEQKKKKTQGKHSKAIAPRPITMDDLRQAKDKVAASVASEGPLMNQIKEWNDLYGEGWSRKKKEQLTYFL